MKNTVFSGGLVKAIGESRSEIWSSTGIRKNFAYSEVNISHHVQKIGESKDYI
jgi:hypothetical protein